MTGELQVNPILAGNLYRLEQYVDDSSGTIHRRIPVTLTGERDPVRQELFGASCILSVNGQPMPINFEIEGATSLADALDKFPDALRQHVKEMQDQALQRKILTPGSIDLSKVRKGN